MEPNHPAYMDTYAWILIQKGQVAKGLRILRNAQLRSPDSPAIGYHIAVALKKLGQDEEALRELRAVIDGGRLFDGIGDARELLTKLSAR